MNKLSRNYHFTCPAVKHSKSVEIVSYHFNANLSVMGCYSKVLP